MKRNIVFQIVLTLILAYQAGTAQVNSTGTNKHIKLEIKADSAWASKPVNNLTTKHLKENSSDYFYRREIYSKALREWGVNFWFNYPGDPRKYEALLIAVNVLVNYWKDPLEGGKTYARFRWSHAGIPVDQEAVKSWKKFYPILRSAYLSSPLLTEEERLLFRKMEMFRFLGDPGKNVEYRQGKKLDLDAFLEVFEDAAAATLKLTPGDIYNKKGGGNIMTILQAIVRNRDSYGLTNDDLELLFQKAMNSKVFEVSDWGQKSLTLFKLKEKPLQFRFQSTDGQWVDLEKLRGKVVLLDFWATWCSTCIAKMPSIKKYYDKYHKLGFEVISISVDAEDNKKNVLKVKDKIGFNWPTVIIGGKSTEERNKSLYVKLRNEYGFASVPQLLLLDKNGLLAEYQGVLQNGDPEPLLQKLLTENNKK